MLNGCSKAVAIVKPFLIRLGTDHVETQASVQVRESLKGLTLDNAAVWVKEKQRQKQPDHPNAPWFITGPYLALCWVLDVIYDGRPIERFWFLETVARMPYFAYISMLHLYESLGWWRAGAELRRVPFSIEFRMRHISMACVHTEGRHRGIIKQISPKGAFCKVHWCPSKRL